MNTILNVDDTEAQRYATSRILRHAGFSVEEADSGKQALEMMGRSPDLVILDVNLPDMSGYDVCRRIRSDEKGAHIPVLHLSATMVSTSAKVTGLEGGADAYLVQPVAPEELLATVRALLRLRNAEETLWKSEQQYRLFFEANPLACWISDSADDSILAANEAAVRMYGYSRQEFLNLTVHDIEQEHSSVQNALSERAESVQNAAVLKHRTRHGGILDVEVHWAPLRLAERDVRVAIVQDLTEKLERERAQREEEVNKLLLQKVMQAQEEERRRIARELHDEAGQMMTSLLVGLRTLSDARQIKQVRQQTLQLRKIASDTITELGRLARGLHAGVLYDLGLENALRRVVEEFSAAHNIAVTFEFGKPPFEIRKTDAALGLYRVVQEALTNVARHSRARKVIIKFEWSEPDLRLRIEDDGDGLEMSKVVNRPSEHLGIEGMRQRIAMLGGSLKIESHPHDGMKIFARVPLENLRSERS